MTCSLEYLTYNINTLEHLLFFKILFMNEYMIRFYNILRAWGEGFFSYVSFYSMYVH